MVISLSWRTYSNGSPDYSRNNATIAARGMATVPVNGDSRHGLKVGGVKDKKKEYSDGGDPLVCVSN